MKAQRRHDLKENDLMHALSVARKYLDEHGTRIGVAVIVVVAIVLGVLFGIQSRTTALESIWRRKSELSFEDLETGKQSLEALAAMTRDASDEQFVLVSLMDQGTQALRLARDVAFPPDRELNNTAGQAFEQMLARFPGNPLAVGLAHSGLATVEENAFALDLDPAHKNRAEAHLVAIIDDPALNGLPFKRIAMDRRKALDTTFTDVMFDQSPREEEAIQPSMLEPIRIEPMQLAPVGPTDSADEEFVDPADPVDEELPVDKAEPGDSAGAGAAEGSEDAADSVEPSETDEPAPDRTGSGSQPGAAPGAEPGDTP